ncbi:unnamed protein product [Schistosoma rodhaini]|uniref:MATH domain-containing protein n=1 Tax=Schistosoma rodhaini TaxID=6188 RepID=A0AA85EJW6_9TREM|nr:unnamed protein product [Schistosoma rodhaini]
MMNNQFNKLNKITNLQLYRIIQLNDSQIFSFIIPSQFIKGYLQNIQSKKFYYSGHYWFIRIEYYIDTNNDNNDKESKTTTTTNSSISSNTKQFIQYNKKPLNISIHLCNPLSNGMLCHLKSIKFTIPHQHDYTLNLINKLDNLYFNSNNLSYKLLLLLINNNNNQLFNDNYLFDNYTCLLEVELSQLITIYEEQLRIPRDNKELLRCKSLETTTFIYDNMDWSLIIDWNHLYYKSKLFNKDNITTHNKDTTDKEIDNKLKCYIQRHSTLNYWSRIKYILHINWNDLGIYTTELLDHLINPENDSKTNTISIGEFKWFTTNTNTNYTTTNTTNTTTNNSNIFPILTSKHKIYIKIQFYSITHMNMIHLIPTLPQGNQNCTHFIDPYNMKWFIMSDILGTYVRLKLFNSNESTILSNKNDLNLEVRSTAWIIELIPYNKTLNIIKSMNPYYVIYTKMDMNQTEIKSQYQEVVLNLDVEKVCSPNFGYSRPSDNAITLRIEWLYSHILCSGDYQNYDELVAKQRYYLLRDINNKDLENERLSKLKLDQVSTSSRENEDHKGKLSESNYIKRSSYLRKSSEILSSPKSNFQDSFKMKTTSTKKPISPNHSTYSGNSLTNSPTIRQFLTPSVIINNNTLNSDTINIDKNYLNLNDDPSSNQYWRRHSSCLEDVGTSKPRQRRQLPSPPPSSSSSMKISGDIHNNSTIDRLQTIKTSTNSSPRLSLKNEHSDFGYFN